MVTSTDYQRILDGIYDRLEALDTAGYRWAESDGWHRAPLSSGSVGHLEVWIDLGRAVEWGPHYIVHDAAAVVTLRWTPDDDCVSQARIHAAIRAAMDCLQGWHQVSGERAVPVRASLERIDGEWVAATIEFQLQIERRR